MSNRYLARIRLYKRILVAIASICALIILWHRFTSDSKVTIAEERSVKSSSSRYGQSELKVSRPVFTSKGENSYKIFADKIDKKGGEKYHMHKISGIYNLKDMENVIINALKCDIDESEDKMNLKNNVKIEYEDYIMYTEKMDVDLNKKIAENDNFVEVLGQNGNIKAKKFKTTEEFGKITFYGDVKARFNIGNNNK